MVFLSSAEIKLFSVFFYSSARRRVKPLKEDLCFCGFKIPDNIKSSIFTGKSSSFSFMVKKGARRDENNLF